MYRVNLSLLEKNKMRFNNCLSVSIFNNQSSILLMDVSIIIDRLNKNFGQRAAR